MISHAQRKENHRKMMIQFNAPMTRESLTQLGDDRAKQARYLRRAVLQGSKTAYHQRKSAIESARAFYALAREVTNTRGTK